jgi:hypothetical protein
MNVFRKMKKILIILLAICSFINQNQSNKVLKQPPLNLRKSPLFWYNSWYNNELSRYYQRNYANELRQKELKKQELKRKENELLKEEARRKKIYEQNLLKYQGGSSFLKDFHTNRF